MWKLLTVQFCFCICCSKWLTWSWAELVETFCLIRIINNCSVSKILLIISLYLIRMIMTVPNNELYRLVGYIRAGLRYFGALGLIKLWGPMPTPPPIVLWSRQPDWSLGYHHRKSLKLQMPSMAFAITNLYWRVSEAQPGLNFGGANLGRSPNL